jgi:heterodisulfide reductase subunit C
LAKLVGIGITRSLIQLLPTSVRWNTEQIENLIQVFAFAKIAVSMVWFIVIAFNLTMGIAWHRFLAFFNLYFKRNPTSENALGPLPEMLSHGAPINFEDPKEDDVFGIGTAADISWKGLLDMSTCTECGRCQSQCPAWHTEKPLSPKLLIMAMRDHALSKLPADKPIETKIVGNAHENAISLDVLWSCTTCGACVEECPVDIEHVDHIVNMRRFQVLVESEFPTELGNTFRNLEKAGNPWGANRTDRDAWIAEVDFPITVIESVIPEDVEYLFWVGCAGAYEERAKKPPKRLLNYFICPALSLAFLESAKLVQEIQHVAAVTNFYIKFYRVKISRLCKKLLEHVVLKRLLLPVRTALQQLVEITNNRALICKWCTILNY